VTEINWDCELGKWGHAIIGREEITPGVVFTVEKTYTPDKLKDGTFVTRFLVSHDLYGCTSGMTFTSRDACEAYLKRQIENGPKYATLGAKRNALADRMKPLQRKWSENSDQLFKLAKA